MTAQIVSLKLPARWARDWSQQELAEFYRVESALIQAGLGLETVRGLSDEGDPWFSFCRRDTGEVFIHFARIGGEYVIDGGPFEQVVRGPNFPALIRELIGKQPLAQARARGNSNIFLHPAALLIALIGGAFFHSGEAKAAETHAEHHPSGLRRQVVLILSGASAAYTSSTVEAAQAAAILTGVMIGLNQKAAFQAPLSMNVARPVASDFILPTGQGPSVVARAAQPSTPAAVTAPQTTEISPDPNLTTPLHISLGSALEPAAALSRALSTGMMTELLQHPLSGLDRALGLAQPLLPTLPISVGHTEIEATSSTDAVEAIQMVQDIVHFDPASTPWLLKLPAALTSVIGQGEHVGLADGPSSTAVASSTPVVDQTSPTVPSSGAASANTSGLVGGSGSASTAVAASPPSPPAAAPSAPSPSISPAGAGYLNPHDPAVSAAVSHFVNEIQSTDVVVSGHDVVIYDGAIMNATITTPLESLTFHFSDGSTLSLVGTVVEIYALHYGS